MYAVYKQAHPPTGLEFCLYCHFFGAAERNLVVAGTSQLCVYRLNHDAEVLPPPHSPPWDPQIPPPHGTPTSPPWDPRAFLTPKTPLWDPHIPPPWDPHIPPMRPPEPF